MPYVKIHQLAAYVRTGKRTGLGVGAATIAAPPGSRKTHVVAGRLSSLSQQAVHSSRITSGQKQMAGTLIEASAAVKDHA